MGLVDYSSLGVPAREFIEGKHSGNEKTADNLEGFDFLEKGNIDLYNRPRVKNPDNSISTVRTKSFNLDGNEVLLPTISDEGKNLSDEETVDQYLKTGKHLGKFSSPEEASKYAVALHNQQEEMINADISSLGVSPADFISSNEQKDIETERSKPTSSIGPIGQFLAGASEYFTWPADVYKLLAKGEALSDIEDLKKIPGFDEKKYLSSVEEAAESFPTQEKAEKYLQENTGVRFEPKGEAEQIARKAGEFLSPKNIFKGGVKSVLKNVGKKTALATGGAVVSEGMEKSGVNPYVATLAGAHVSSIGEAGRKLLSEEGRQIKSTADKYGLRQAQFMAEEKPLTPSVITKARANELKKDIGSTSKQSIENIIDEKLPISKLRKQNISLDDYTSKLRNKAIEESKNIKKPISMDPVIKRIDEEIKNTKSSAPHLSDADDRKIKILSDIRKDLIESPIKEPSVNILDKFGNKIAKPKEMPKAKELNGPTFVNQYTKFNDDRKAFYKNPTMRGLEEAADKAYAIVNDAMKEAADLSGANKFSKYFKASNNAYHQSMNIKQTESILRPFFEDLNPKTLDRIVQGDRKSKFLSRTIGVEGLNDLRQISKYGKNAINKLEENFTVGGENWVDLAKNLGKTSLLALATPNVAAALDLGIAGSYVRGLMLTNKNIREDYVDLLKSYSTGNKKAIRIASTKLNKSFSDEYGNIDDIIKNPE